MRSLFFTGPESGLSRGQLRWGEMQGRWRRVERQVFRLGPEDPSALDRSLALVLVSGGVASGTVAGVLHGFDSVELGQPEVSLDPGRSHTRPGVRRRALSPDRVTTIVGWPCTDGLQTLVDLAGVLGDDVWEQALESALRKDITTIEAIRAALPELGRARTAGVARIRRVLARRPPGAPPTESLLETLALQLARTVPELGEPVRQLVVVDAAGRFVARVDLAWPDPGLFLELDGQHHAGQPLYDSRRETAIIAATGWLPGRFTWEEVRRHPRATTRRLEELAMQARRRRLPKAM